MTPLHVLVVLLLLPLLWVVIRAFYAYRHGQRPTPELADDALSVTRWVCEGDFDAKSAKTNVPISIIPSAVYARVLVNSDIFMLTGFVLGAVVCKCLSL